MTQKNPNALSVKMEDALLHLVKCKSLTVGSNSRGSIALIQAEALIKRGLAMTGESKAVKATYSDFLNFHGTKSNAATTSAPTLVPTEQGVEKAKAVLSARGGV